MARGAGCCSVLGEKVRRRGAGALAKDPKEGGRRWTPFQGRTSVSQASAPEGVAWSSRSQTFHEPPAKNESGEERPPQPWRLSNRGPRGIRRDWGRLNSASCPQSHHAASSVTGHCAKL